MGGIGWWGCWDEVGAVPVLLSRMKSQSSLESLEESLELLLLLMSLIVSSSGVVLGYLFFAESAAVVERVTRGILGLVAMSGLAFSFFFKIDFKRGFSASGRVGSAVSFCSFAILTSRSPLVESARVSLVSERVWRLRRK